MKKFKECQILVRLEILLPLQESEHRGSVEAGKVKRQIFILSSVA
jgi:hypothetical protein